MFTRADAPKVFILFRGSIFNILRVLCVVFCFLNVGLPLREEGLFSTGIEQFNLRRLQLSTDQVATGNKTVLPAL